MKRVTNGTLAVTINYELDDIESIKFVFTQGYKKLFFDYPSQNAIRKEGENVVLLYWNIHQTAMFEADDVEMDTFIKLKESEQNPETPIVTFKMNPSLFREGEV